MRTRAQPLDRARYALTLALGAFLASSVAGVPQASAQSKTFAATSLVIPMDWCYQTSSVSGTPPAYCTSPNTTKSDGIFKAYGLVWNLIKKGVPVYLVIDSAKTQIDGIDVSVSSPSSHPVERFDRATGGTIKFHAAKTIDYRGAPFAIDAADAARALALIRSDPAFAPTFNNVIIHVAQQTFTARVAMILSGTPPRVALNNLGGSATGVLTGYLADAGLDVAGAGGVYPATKGTIYDQFDDDADFTSGGLLAGGYRIVWSPHWVGGTGAPAVMSAIASFVDAGNAYFAECASIETDEGSYSNGSTKLSVPATPLGDFMTTKGVWKNGISTSWGRNAGEQWKYSDVTNPYVQMGDFGFNNTGGHIHQYRPNVAVASTYKPGVQRLVTSYKAGDPINSDWDIHTFTRKDNDPTKGPIIYLAGHDYGGMIGGERLVLNTLLFLGNLYAVGELTRSSPIVYADGSTFQGSYDGATTPAAAYPPVTGHFRRYPAGGLGGANVTAFDKLGATWDAAKLMPSAANRTLFTAVAVGGKLTQTSLTTTNAATLAAPLGVATAALATPIINGVRAGALGGVDRSTPAIIGPSTRAGTAARPTIAYVGGLDGMLHAIGVSGAGVTPGVEAWAFIPPSQIGKLRTYQAGVDGSPQVGDVFVDDGTGVRSWKTLVAITCGEAFGGTVDVLDVTDPLSPKYLWSGANTSGSYAMGAAAGASFGMVSRGGAAGGVIYLATRNAGPAGNGINVYALDAGSGSVLWQWNRLYTRKIVGTTTLVPNEVPGTPAVLNLAGDGGLDDAVFVGDLDGRVWRFDADLKGGAPSAALYDAGADGYPIGSVSIYRDANSLRPIIVGATSGRDWVPATVVPFVFGVEATRFVPGSTATGVVAWKTNLAAGERAYAAPTIAGNDLYLITSFGNFTGSIITSATDNGNVRRFNLSLGNSTGGTIPAGTITATTAVKKGASEVAIGPDGTIVAASAGGLTTVGNLGRDANGTALNPKERPFIVSAWLDLR